MKTVFADEHMTRIREISRSTSEIVYPDTVLMTTGVEPRTHANPVMAASAGTTPLLGRATDSQSHERRLFSRGNNTQSPCALIIMLNDTDTATMLLLFPNEKQEFNRGLQGMADMDANTAAWSPARASMERLLCRIHGRAIALKMQDEECRSDGAAHRGQAQPFNRPQFMLDMVKPPVVVCIGIAAYNHLQNLSLQWQPSIVVARHTIAWSSDYEDTLAQEINDLLLALTSAVPSSLTGTRS